ncbi:hypothetical protein EVJ24_12320 [Exiguobacterium sp. SH1S21]|uniref:hypothetical protein n=1 Tax=unclassified Exiguobacterium TaxID=2644629 RepID=UPI00103CCD8F|nr:MULTISPECIES: hypothetical protein [unclassified Exiguobacterium]TCI51912.1 hypothetical protein EVJ24_12320 [Exiguobacterium sp. SH1S21]TCI69045.1 hypothetical protein EVJ22_11270 [Exiguobacterium sp. SH0S7]
MHQITSYFFLYAKIVLTDKVPFLLTMGLPLGVALLYSPPNIGTMTSAEYATYLSYFWVYIILATYLNGIALELARMREYGLMKTYVMISGNKYTYMLAILLAQLLFAAISLLLFTVVVTLVHGHFTFGLLASPILLLLGSFPFALGSVVLTLLPVKVSSLMKFANILTYPLFLLAVKQPDVWFGYANPFYALLQLSLAVVHGVTQVDVSFNLITTILSLVGYVIVGLFAMNRFNLVSSVTR